MKAGQFVGLALAGQALVLLGVGFWLWYGPGQGMVFFGICLFIAALTLGNWVEHMTQKEAKRPDEPQGSS